MSEPVEVIQGNITVKLTTPDHHLDEGPVSEVIVLDPNTGSRIFCLKKMSENFFLFQAYGTTGDLVVGIRSCLGRYIDWQTDANGNVVGERIIKTGLLTRADFSWEDKPLEKPAEEETASGNESSE